MVTVLTLNVTTTLLVDAFWWLMPLVGILVYAREEVFFLTMR
jgi:hypothetical protein